MTYAVPQTATVYKALNGRRYLTRAAAYHKSAVVLVRRKHACECEGPDYHTGYPGYSCENHGERFDRLVKRLARWLKWRDAREVTS